MDTLIGVTGAIFILFGFYRTSIGQWTGKSFWYEMDNLVGAILLTIYAVNHRTYINVVLNVIWAVVALRGITSYKQRVRKK